MGAKLHAGEILRVDQRSRGRPSMILRTLFLIALIAATLCAQPRPLEIYWIDTEGGAATLILTPAGQSLLVDAGNPGERDAQRIHAVTKLAGLSKIDFLLTT